jgi:hypothetical protein
MTSSKSNAPKKTQEGEPKQKVSSTEKKPADVPLHDNKEESRGGERGLPVKDGSQNSSAI